MGDSELQALVEEFVVLDEEELFAEVGAADAGDTLGVRPADLGRFIRSGRLWLDEHIDDVRTLVCGQPEVVALRGQLDAKPTEAAAAVADLLAGVYGHVIAAAVAVLVVRAGLDRLCS